jgi:nitrate/nitrite transport system permease protein
MKNEHGKSLLLSVVLFALFIGVWFVATQPKESAQQSAAQDEYAALMGKGAAKSGGFPPPQEIGKAIVTHLSDPSRTTGRTTRASPSSSAIRWAASAWALRWRSWWPCRLASPSACRPCCTGPRPLHPGAQTHLALAWMPLALYTIKDSDLSGIFVIFICSVWPMLINTAFGVANVRGMAQRRPHAGSAAAPQGAHGDPARRGAHHPHRHAHLDGHRLAGHRRRRNAGGGHRGGYFVWNEWNNLACPT